MSNEVKKPNQVTVLEGVSKPEGEPKMATEKVTAPPPARDDEWPDDTGHLSDARHARQSTRPRDRNFPR